jgi:cytochrome c-type biogenesis protein CcmH
MADKALHRTHPALRGALAALVAMQCTFAVAAEAGAAPVAASAPVAVVTASSPATATAVASAPAAPPRAVPTASDPALEARMLAITSELRCLVCQNQTIADSHADLAADLRQEVREMLQAGRSPDEVRRYMTDRYGDFILYRPPFKPTTMLLWLGPALLLAIGTTALVVSLLRRRRLGDDRFEADPVLDEPDAPDNATPAGAETTR